MTMEPRCYRVMGLLGMLSAAVSVPANSEASMSNPLRFFEGRTESATTVKIMTQEPFISRSVGRGRIKPDGSLELFQHVSEHGRRDFDRWWQIREVRPGHFAGRMSEAIGPVSIDLVGGRYRFRFKMKNNMSAEQWLTPQSDTAARMQLTIRKFGIAIVHSEGWIRKVD
jgi:hypothetical protein